MYFRVALAPLAVLCAVVASLLLAACGGASPKATATQENEERLVNFARCMREHGVNVSTSTESGKGQLRVNGSTPQAMDAAQSACKRYQPSAGKQNLTPQEKVALEEAVMKFAKCMRERGINVHTSTAGGGVRIQTHRVGGGERGPNPESPAFQAAQKACQGLLPSKGAHAPGPGPVTGTAKGAKSGAGASLSLGG
jgi:hypothetical protein